MRQSALTVTLLMAAAIIFALALMPSRLCFSGGKNYTFYCGSSSADCREVAGADSPSLTRLTLKSVCGESVEYENFDLEKFLDGVDGKVIFVEELSDSVNYYCSADLPYSVNLYGHEINLHVCVRGKSAKAASPIIFGGY